MFSHFNGVRIYPFTMIIPRPTGMPKVVDYLKEAAAMKVGTPAATWAS